MIQKLRGNNSKGFTLIELMIVIAIIGILAAIAIPNFIAYRNKAFCSAAESDANAIGAVIADYFAIPAHVTYVAHVAQSVFIFSPQNRYKLSGASGSKNTATLSGPVGTIVITVTDGSTRCPADYQAAQPNWAGGVFTKTMGF